MAVEWDFTGVFYPGWDKIETKKTTEDCVNTHLLKIVGFKVNLENKSLSIPVFLVSLRLEINSMNNKPNISFANTEVAFAHKTDGELQKMHRFFSLLHYPNLVNAGIWATEFCFKWGIPIGDLVKDTVFKQFCGGETISACKPTIGELASYGIATLLDYSVEGKKEDSSFDQTQKEILQIIENAKGNEHLPFAVFKVSGIADTGLLTKVQEGKSLSAEEKESFKKAKERIMALCEAAYQANTSILIDGEESWFQDVIDDIALEAMEKFNKETAVVYNTYQLYRRDMLRKLKDAHHDAVAKSYFLGAKLVRGAYMEKERERAEEMGYDDPIHPTKFATDKDFDKALQFCVNNKQRIYLVNGSHNELSNTILTELIDLHGLDRADKRVYFSQLYGMSDHISFNLSKAGFNVVKYLPYGPVKEVLPYLYRRAEENTSITGQTKRELQLIKQEIHRRKHQPKLPKIA